MKFCTEDSFCWAAAWNKVPEAPVYVTNIFSAIVREGN